MFSFDLERWVIGLHRWDEFCHCSHRKIAIMAWNASPFLWIFRSIQGSNFGAQKVVVLSYQCGLLNEMFVLHMKTMCELFSIEMNAQAQTHIQTFEPVHYIISGIEIRFMMWSIGWKINHKTTKRFMKASIKSIMQEFCVFFVYIGWMARAESVNCTL